MVNQPSPAEKANLNIRFYRGFFIFLFTNSNLYGKIKELYDLNKAMFMGVFFTMVKMHSHFRILKQGFVNRIATTRLCIFRCVASVAHLFFADWRIYEKKKSNRHYRR